MDSGEVLGLDVGIKRTGIARASAVARLAEPLMTISTNDALKQLHKYINEHAVEAIAVGLPRSLESKETRQTAWVREWVDKAKLAIDIPLYWQDEALTSVQAEELKASYKSDIDAVSAAIILQDFLDAPEADRKLA